MESYDGIVVPGGFGSRGVDGKIRAARYALDHKLPYLGLCYGLHMAVIAAARNSGIADAHTTEVDPDTKHAVIDTMDGQKGLENTGGTMRLGNYNCHLEKGSLAAKVYGAQDIIERHRHRYECVAKYQAEYDTWGIRASGINPDNKLIEVIEAAERLNHPFFLASQFHPEFKSRPTRPHPMFDGFISSLLQKHRV
jgi:CTP synthase